MIPSPQYDNYLISSTLLWLDNRILSTTSGFYNTNTPFYPVKSPYSAYQCYASPFNQFIADSSISGATIGSGVWINNTFRTTGQGGLCYIDYMNGRIYTTGLLNTTSISGEFGVKYFNVKTTDEPEQSILTETAYSIRPKTFIQATGLQTNQLNYPVVYIKSDGSFNKTVGLGSKCETVNNLKIFVFTDSAYSLDVINSCLRDSCKSNILMLSQNHFPFNHFGDLKTGSFNYVDLVSTITGTNDKTLISEVYIKQYTQSNIEIRKLNPKVYWSIINMTTLNRTPTS